MNHNHPHHRNNPDQGGFTIAEMLIATTILIFMIGSAAAISSNFFNSLRNIQAANTVYDEANFTMERIIKEIRNGTVDYEEYYNQAVNFFGIEFNQTYGQNYCQYSRQFYAPGPDGQFGTFDDESTGERRNDPAPIASPMQSKLYLIDSSGTHRTYVQHVIIEKPDINGKLTQMGKVAILKLVGKDYGINHRAWNPSNPQLCRDSGEGDGLIDTWICDTGFKCAKEVFDIIHSENIAQPYQCYETLYSPLDTPGHLNDVNPNLTAAQNSVPNGTSSFVDITPETIDVVSLDFIITPQDDPRKAYNDAAVQVQPNVTVKMVTRASPQIASTFRGQTPTIVLESTISTRASKEVITECNLQECIDGDKRPCPKHTGMLVAAKQTCSQGIWPGCVETCETNPSGESCYEEVATIFIKANPPAGAGADGLDHDAAFGGASGAGRSFYESAGGEIGSCGTDDACKIRRCSDNVDNDVNDRADNADPACLNYVCNNGYLDPGEECYDVGGICSFIHPQVSKELTDEQCKDRYDNDCSYDFDLKWDAFWASLTADQKLSATAMGLNANSSTAQMNIFLGQGANEYDKNCIDSYYCSNGLKDPPMGAKKFGPKFYATPYYLVGKPESNDLSETCVDIGGLCELTTDGEHKKTEDETGSLCGDGLDNDCDFNQDLLDPEEGADEFDSECKPVLCGNRLLNDDLIDPSLIDGQQYLYDYLVSYEDIGQVSSLDEQCVDVGGLCGGTTAEDAPASCSDSIDNDCDGKMDGVIDLRQSLPQNDPNFRQPADPNCCPNADGDLFSPLLSTCQPKNATAANSAPPGYIDCNDNDPSIHPYPGVPASDGSGTLIYPEVCDNAKYPADYPNSSLADTFIDNNCSAINNLYGGLGDSGRDDEDPSCCVDTDEDNFGIKEANLFRDVHHVPARCSASPTQQNVERTLFDCNDVNADINPNAPENTALLCSDPHNNSCRFIDGDPTKQPRMNHIDMYVNPSDPAASLKAAFDAKKFNPDCCQVTQNPLFPGREICDDSNSLLSGSPIGSDENCNGLEGYDDDICVGFTGRKFHDNLTSSEFIADGATGFNALWNQALGIITLNPAEPAPQVAFSAPVLVDNSNCSNITSVMLNHDATFPEELTYEVTENGTTWLPATIGVSTPTPLQEASRNLAWRVTLNQSDVNIPILNKVTLTWTCDSEAIP